MHNGRPVIDRGELVRRLGIGQSTAEAWYRDRDRNGHPAPVLAVGRRLFFDEAELLAWARQHAHPADRITREGRTLVARAEVGRLTGLSQPALHALYAQRATSGHPEPAYRAGRRLYFDEAEVLAWDQARRVGKQAGLTEVDRRGDPEELVDRHEAARLLGYSSPKVIDSYRARNLGYFPDPDAIAPLRWRRASLWAFADRRSRPGRAGHPRAARNDDRPRSG
jgi:predicted DNA-binding transcriptional regulator AlpA